MYIDTNGALFHPHFFLPGLCHFYDTTCDMMTSEKNKKGIFIIRYINGTKKPSGTEGVFREK